MIIINKTEIMLRAVLYLYYSNYGIQCPFIGRLKLPAGKIPFLAPFSTGSDAEGTVARKAPTCTGVWCAVVVECVVMDVSGMGIVRLLASMRRTFDPSASNCLPRYAKPIAKL